MQKRIFIALQYLLPQHLLSVLMGMLADNNSRWFKNLFITLFIKKYKVDMPVTKEPNIEAYKNFNAFFIRELNPIYRPIASEEMAIACPADGVIAQIGHIKQNQLLQAKGFDFDLNSLLGGDLALTATFMHGSYTTIYLAPHNYHRVHMPLLGKLVKTIFIPGKLFSVNSHTSESIPSLYSKNERLICVFETMAGPMVIILVGAMIVGSIQPVWMNHPVRAPQKTITASSPIELAKGAEIGHFKMGSTVIVLFSQHRTTWLNNLIAGSAVNFGQLIGNILI